MADYARGALRSKRRQLELALQGTLTTHQRELLSRLLVQMQALEFQVAEVTEEIERRVACHEDLIQRLDTIPGIDRITAWTVLAEIGTDMTVFGDAAHLASWAALFRRVRSRRGEQKAIMAVAHQLLVIMFYVVRDGSVYQELGEAYYDRQNKSKVAQRLMERLQKLATTSHCSRSKEKRRRSPSWPLRRRRRNHASGAVLANAPNAGSSASTAGSIRK